MNDREVNQEQKAIQILRTLKETPPRDEDAVTRGRQAFLTQAQQISDQPVSIPLLKRLINGFSRPKVQMRFSTLTIGIILGVLLLTFSSSAYAARLSKPGQFLYPFKLWLEDSRMSLTKQTDQQIDLHLIYAEERLKELSVPDNVYSTSDIDRAMNNLSSHLDAINNLMGDEEGDHGQKEQLDKILLEYQQLESQENDVEFEEQIDGNSSSSEQDDIPVEEHGSENDIGNQSEDNQESPEDQSSGQPTNDDLEDTPEVTDEPDDNSSNESNSSDIEDTTKTQEPENNH